MSTVDVVVPCYNYGRYLRGCIDSILQQKGVDVRVLIIDDASRDSTPEVGRELARLDNRVEFRRHDTNLGHIATYNEGLLSWACADYSLLLSADDMLAPGALERATQLMDHHSDVGMTYGMALTFSDESDIPVPADAPIDEYQVIPGSRYIERVCAHGNSIPTPTAVVRTSLQKRLGGYNMKLPHSGDMEMWMRFAAAAPIGVSRAVQAYYRRHPANMSSRYYARSIGDRVEQYQACSAIYARWGSSISGFPGWMAAMRRRLGSELVWEATKAFEAGDEVG